MVWKGALSYFAVVFAAAFAMGVVRVLILAPAIGAFAAVMVEVPLILALSWIVAGRTIERWPMTLPGRIGMGAIAFACLILTEFALATVAFGISPADYAADLATPAGILRFIGQIGFALIPPLRQVRG